MIADRELEKGMMTMKIIWFAMLGALAVYLFVAIHIGASIQPSMNEDTFNVLRTILYALALATLAATRYIRKLVLSGKIGPGQPSPVSRHPMLQKYSAATVLSLAMSESIGIYGFVLFLLGKNSMDLYLLLLISAAAIVMYRPRKGQLISLMQEGQGDSATGGTVA